MPKEIAFSVHHKKNIVGGKFHNCAMDSSTSKSNLMPTSMQKRASNHILENCTLLGLGSNEIKEKTVFQKKWCCREKVQHLKSVTMFPKLSIKHLKVRGE